MSTIKFLVDDNVQEIMEVEELEDWTNNYVQVIYNPISIQVSSNLVLNNQMNEAMICKVNKEEVRKVVFGMNQYKALGPNGFPLAFFRNSGIFLSMAWFTW